MIVAGTHTLSDYWGSYQYIDGYFLNNSLKNFANKGVNKFDYMKRPKTFISPLILISKDETIAIGSAGAYAIPQNIPFMLYLRSYQNLEWQEIVNTQRFAIDRQFNYLIEPRNLRSIPMQFSDNFYYSFGSLTEGNRISVIALSTIENAQYKSYYDAVWCSEECSITFK